MYFDQCINNASLHIPPNYASARFAFLQLPTPFASVAHQPILASVSHLFSADDFKDAAFAAPHGTCLDSASACACAYPPPLPTHTRVSRRHAHYAQCVGRVVVLWGAAERLLWGAPGVCCGKRSAELVFVGMCGTKVPPAAANAFLPTRKLPQALQRGERRGVGGREGEEGVEMPRVVWCGVGRSAGCLRSC